jgi:hypothetical protein
VSRRSRKVLLLGLLPVALAGCAGAHPTVTASSFALPKPRAAVDVTGGSTLERRLLREVITRFEPRTIEAVAISKSPPRWWSRRSALDLTITHLAGSPGRIRGQWEGWIVAGALGRRLVQHGLKGTITVRGAQGALVHPREFHTPDPPPAAAQAARLLAGSLHGAAARSGGRVVEARVRRPYGLAPMITLQVPHPAEFLKHRLRRILELYGIYGGTWERRDEGTYVEIVDRAGRVVFEAGGSTRARVGALYVPPVFASCSPVSVSSGLPGARPPRNVAPQPSGCR